MHHFELQLQRCLGVITDKSLSLRSFRTNSERNITARSNRGAQAMKHGRLYEMATTRSAVSTRLAPGLAAH